jgi:hypothetical protein
MVAVSLLGGEIQSLPPLNGLKTLKNLKATSEGEAVFLEDTMILARECGNDEVYKVVRRTYRRYQLSLIPSLLDRYVFANYFRNLYRRLKKPDWLNCVTVRSSSWSDW